MKLPEASKEPTPPTLASSLAHSGSACHLDWEEEEGVSFPVCCHALPEGGALPKVAQAMSQSYIT